MSVARSRWAALGAAVAVTLGAGGIGLVAATSPEGATAYVPITPCRLADTRAGEFNVGPKSSPLGPDETYTAEATGDHGECTGVPASATGLQLNVTALGATDPTFITVWGDGDQPNSSNLNPLPGDGPVPNTVTTGLTPSGGINLFNAFGSVDVIVDVAGYYTDHDHDDRYFTETESDDRYLMHWLIGNMTGTTPRSASPGLEGTVIFRPPSSPIGIYCLVFPDDVSIERNGIAGTIEDHVAGVQDWGIAVNSTVNTACGEGGAQWDVAVTTTNSGALANAGWRLLIPPRR